MNKDSLAVPISIVIAAGLIAGAIYMNGGKQAPVVENNNQEPIAAEIELAPVTETDHVRGNPNAPIIIVEYSDFDCPFCNQFHGTMNKIMAEYGADGKVAWVFRHFPIPQLHPNAPKIAEASECVSELAGNEAFWKFSDLVFGSKTVQEFTDMKKLSDYAVASGVTDKAAFENCFASGKYTKTIADATVAAQKAGGKGTPYPVIIAGEDFAPLRGAEPYEAVKGYIDNLLAQQGNAN